eukprot:TRINITY_DN85477_c0_g1_i1.p1 TRINITY_DN85477_c0_g1~~TRINITY_DN85477_c0_g1_i1.p1  ORF type:complete len:208 (+),score=48.98 TRINITY_DN85477_c0_g1_i1:61-624(+)
MAAVKGLPAIPSLLLKAVVTSLLFSSVFGKKVDIVDPKTVEAALRPTAAGASSSSRAAADSAAFDRVAAAAQAAEQGASQAFNATRLFLQQLEKKGEAAFSEVDARIEPSLPVNWHAHVPGSPSLALLHFCIIGSIIVGMVTLMWPKAVPKAKQDPLDYLFATRKLDASRKAGKSTYSRNYSSGLES